MMCVGSGEAMLPARCPAGPWQPPTTSRGQAGMKQMNIQSVEAYEAAQARIREITGAEEGTPEAAEMAELVAAIQRWESRPIQGDASSPGHFNTVPRPGQPGEQNEYRAGPNPRSGHPTGPHPPYEPDDPEGTAAEKHHGKPAPLERKGARAQPSGTIEIVDLRRR